MIKDHSDDDIVILIFDVSNMNVGFRYREFMVDPYSVIDDEVQKHQIISGLSEPIDNARLPKSIYNSQPNGNKLFDGYCVYIHIEEKPKEEISNPLFFEARLIGNELVPTLYWCISDRQLFTRLLTQLYARDFLTFEISTNVLDSEIDYFCFDDESEYREMILIRSLMIS
jgi:hypothetical protein